jgi:hypothetical protein
MAAFHRDKSKNMIPLLEREPSGIIAGQESFASWTREITTRLTILIGREQQKIAAGCKELSEKKGAARKPRRPVSYKNYYCGAGCATEGNSLRGVM